jgi:hypothetical protein
MLLNNKMTRATNKILFVNFLISDAPFLNSAIK